MKYLNFKGLIFDDFTEDENIWVTVCPSCAKRHSVKLGNRVDEFGSGCCSVCGCDDMDGEFYVDFDPHEVEILDFDLIPAEDVDLEIDRLEMSIFWIKPLFNGYWYPVIHIYDGDLTVFHREGGDNWWGFVDKAFEFINEYLREV